MTALDHPKISPAFEPFLARGRPHERHEAVVIYRGAPIDTSRPRSRLRALDRRLEHVADLAAAGRPVEARVADAYLDSARRADPHGEPLAVTRLASGTLPVALVEVTRATLPLLASQPDVVAILPDQPVRLMPPAAIGYGRLRRQQVGIGVTWGLEALGAPELWRVTRGAGIRVAVLDTGVHADHPALAGRVAASTIIDPLGRRIHAEPMFDGGQHGTHVCGTIAGGRTPDGVSIGMAPEARLLVAGVLVGAATLRTVMEGIAWAVEHGADILNLSLGFSAYEPLFTRVFEVLMAEYGVLPVVSIGNDSHGSTSSPGNAPDGFSVGAVERRPRGRPGVAFFSGGASLEFPGDRAAAVTKPDVVAPGAQVYACIPPTPLPDGTHAYAFMDGTSMAAPHVSGAAALLMAARPEAPPDLVARALRDTAWHPGGRRRRPDNRWGHGLIRPVEALKALG